MRVLITGCRGFIGGSAGRYAALAGHEVFGIGRSSQPTPSWLGQYMQADILHADLTNIVRGFAPDVVLHAAGTASVGASLDTPLDDLRAAVLTWANTLEGVRRSGLKPVILFPSSAAVYGNPITLPISEEARIAPVSPYGFHKAACELVAQEYAECFGLDTIVCRLFSVFGPAQKRLLVWELFQQFAGSNQEVQIKGTGQETRDYLYVDDISKAFLDLASVSPEGRHGGCNIINIASGIETPILNLAGKMRDLMAPQKTIICQGIARPGDPTRWQADIRKLTTLLPQARPNSFDVNLAQCIAFWQQEMS